jgi:hypothetical protein
MSLKAKVLSELLEHMISMHGKKSPHESNEMPKPDGSLKHSKKDKVAGMAIIAAKPDHEEEMLEDESPAGDLFGRKSGKKEYF